MPKFRTMRINTPAVATHLMKNPDIYLTPIGSFLRRFSLDELPIPVKVEFDGVNQRGRPLKGLSREKTREHYQFVNGFLIH